MRNAGAPFFQKKEGFTALNRRMLPVGRLLVSCRTSGSLNRPLAALTSGAPDPSEESRFAGLPPGVGLTEKATTPPAPR